MPHTEMLRNANEALLSEVSSLRAKLAETEQKLSEAQEVITAIHSGDVDAVVVSSPEGDKVFTLEGAEYTYRALVETMHEGAATLSPDGIVLYCNQRLSELAEDSLEHIIGSPVLKVVSQNSRRDFEAALEQAIRNEPGTMQIDLITGRGTLVPVQVALRRMPSADPVAVCMVVTDLRELRSRDELIAEGKLAKSIIESAAEAMVVCDESGIVIASNAPFEELCQCNPVLKEFRAVLPITKPDDTHLEFSLQKAVAGRVIRGVEVALQRNDKKYALLISSSPIQTSSAVVGCVLTIIDITERKTAEDALRRQAELLDLAHDAIIVRDWDGKISFWSRGAEAMYGFSKSDVLGKISHNVFQTSFPIPLAEIEGALRRLDSWEGELKHIAASGAQITVASRWAIHRDKSGHVVGVMEINRDITEQKRTEAALRQSQSRFDLLFSSDLMGIGIPDRSGAFLEANDELLRMLGYTREDLDNGRVRWDLMTPPEYHQLDLDHIQEAAERGSCTPYEKEYLRKDGTRLPITCGYALLAGSQDAYIGFVQDMTGQKQAERALKDREERFRALAETLPQMIWIIDSKGENEYSNAQWLSYIGRGLEQTAGIGWLDLVYPDDQNTTLNAWRKAVAAGENFVAEVRLRRHDGVYRSFLCQAVAIRADDGKIERWIGSSTDIDDQKRTEEALRRSEKLATAGRLAASIAHEINNPLASVMNLVFLARSADGIPEKSREYLISAEQELARVAHLTTQTLRFHKQSTSATLADLGEIMESVIALFSPRFTSSEVEVTFERRTETKLFCYNDELRQVFANLISNALEACRSGDRIKVRISDSRSWSNSGVKGIRVLVADTGRGIPESMKQKVYEPFVSSKEETRVGLGLWISEGIVTKHRGAIRHRSRCNPEKHGTVFSLCFPMNGLTKTSGQNES